MLQELDSLECNLCYKFAMFHAPILALYEDFIEVRASVIKQIHNVLSNSQVNELPQTSEYNLAAGLGSSEEVGKGGRNF